VRWKPFQQRLPTREEGIAWFAQQFPDAGLAVVLGPVSNLLVIDVDGPDAHAELVSRLGSEPVAPKVLSGSRKPYRYHLFFRHPALVTRARITPWHPKLEFRGNKGIVVLPPSLHQSGLRYRWAPGQSLDDVALPEVPAAVLEALSERAAQDASRTQQAGKLLLTPAELTQVQARARAYLATLPPAIEGQGGDKQTFTVACHLVIGFGLSPEEALPLLREYNQRCLPPWTEEELLRKLQEADKRSEARGTLLESWGRRDAARQEGQSVKAVGVQDGPLPAFVSTVPDFVQADWLRARPRIGPLDSEGRRKLGRARIGGGFHWAIHLAVIEQRSARVVVPDVLLGHVPSRQELSTLGSFCTGRRRAFVHPRPALAGSLCDQLFPGSQVRVPHAGSGIILLAASAVALSHENVARCFRIGTFFNENNSLSSSPFCSDAARVPRCLPTGCRKDDHLQRRQLACSCSRPRVDQLLSPAQRDPVHEPPRMLLDPGSQVQHDVLVSEKPVRECHQKGQ
jgi:hypothetical protein